METMRAFVIEEPGGPEKLELREIPRPEPRNGWVLIQNRAFGLNRGARQLPGPLPPDRRSPHHRHGL